MCTIILFVCRNDSKRAHRETDEEGCTPLLVAAKNGDEETLSCLLEHVSELAVKRVDQCMIELYNAYVSLIEIGCQE